MDDKLRDEILWLDLINSDWHDQLGWGRDEDRLLREEWLRRFLAPWGEPLSSGPLAEIRKKLADLRRLIRRMADDFAKNGAVRPADLSALNTVLGGAPLVRRVAASGPAYIIRDEKVESGLRALLADIAASFAEILARGEPRRIKACLNPDCRWIFYDNSKNRSRRWCENATGCGNMMKVRKHRSMKKKE